MTAATWLLLALAGGLGAVTRFKVDSRVGAVVAARRQRRRTADASSAAVTGAGRRLLVAVPLGTVVVNVSACVEAARLMLSGRPWAGFLHAVTMAGTSLLAAVGGLALGAALAA